MVPVNLPGKSGIQPTLNGSLNAEMVITVAAPVTDRDVSIVEPFLRDVTSVMRAGFHYWEVLLVDHGVGDGLVQRVEQLQKELPNVRLIRLSRAHDEEVAMLAALDCSIGDFVVLMDADRDPPDRIPDMIATCASGYEAVVGTTADKGRRPLLRRWASRRFYALLGRLTGHRIDPGTTNFRAFSRRIVDSLVRIKERNRYLKYLTEYVGFRQTTISYERIDRSGRPHELGLLDLTNRAISVIVANSNKPLRWVALTGLAASGFTALYGLAALLIGVLRQRIDGVSAAQGWASTNTFNAAMFFMLFSMMAVLSEYVQRILEESRQRPPYYVAYESNSSVIDQYKRSLNVV